MDQDASAAMAGAKTPRSVTRLLAGVVLMSLYVFSLLLLIGHRPLRVPSSPMEFRPAYEVQLLGWALIPPAVVAIGYLVLRPRVSGFTWAALPGLLAYAIGATVAVTGAMNILAPSITFSSLVACHWPSPDAFSCGATMWPLAPVGLVLGVAAMATGVWLAHRLRERRGAAYG